MEEMLKQILNKLDKLDGKIDNLTTEVQNIKTEMRSSFKRLDEKTDSLQDVLGVLSEKYVEQEASLRRIKIDMRKH